MGNENIPIPPGNERTEPDAETLVVDARAGVSPALMVERKLAAMLRGVPLPASWLLAAHARLVPLVVRRGKVVTISGKEGCHAEQLSGRLPAPGL
jgi:hypothetical protein